MVFVKMIQDFHWKTNFVLFCRRYKPNQKVKLGLNILYIVPIIVSIMSVNNSRTIMEEPDPSREERSGRVREVGSQAVWSLSSCKPGSFNVKF